MDDRNTQSPAGYLVSHLFWGVLSMLWYRALLFRLLPNLSLQQSRLALLGLLALGLLLGWLVSHRRNRNGFNLLITLLLPYEVYTLLSFHAFFRVGRALSLGIAAVLCIALCVWVLATPISPRRNRRTVIANRLHSCLISSRAVCALCLISVLVFATVTQLNGGIPIRVSAIPTAGVWSEENTVRRNMDTLIDLQQERWEQLSINEKLNVMQVAANVERNYLGLPHELKVQTDVLEENVLGSYRHVSYHIVIDADHLQNSPAAEVLNTVAHESYHAYQHAIVDLYLSSPTQYRDLLALRQVRQYAEEFAEYDDGSGDFMDYYMQAVEADAREYAAMSVLDIYTEIELFLAS